MMDWDQGQAFLSSVSRCILRARHTTYLLGGGVVSTRWRLSPLASIAEYVTRVPGGTERVIQVLAPITEPRPITVSPPRIVAPA